MAKIYEGWIELNRARRKFEENTGRWYPVKRDDLRSCFNEVVRSRHVTALDLSTTTLIELRQSWEDAKKVSVLANKNFIILSEVPLIIRPVIEEYVEQLVVDQDPVLADRTIEKLSTYPKDVLVDTLVAVSAETMDARNRNAIQRRINSDVDDMGL